MKFPPWRPRCRADQWQHNNTGAEFMEDLSKLKASAERLIAENATLKAQLAQGDQQSEIDAITAEIDAASPPPAPEVQDVNQPQ